MKGKVKRKVIAWGLSFALVMGTVLGVPGLFMKAHAADAGVLYIIDSISALVIFGLYAIIANVSNAALDKLGFALLSKIGYT